MKALISRPQLHSYFRTPDGKAFAKRLRFWASAAYAIAMLVAFPFIIKYYPDLLEANWHNMKDLMAGRTPDNGALFALLPKMLPSYLFLMVSMLAIGAAAERFKNPLVMLVGIISIFAYGAAYAMYTLSISGISSYTVKWWRSKDEASQFD